MSQPRKPKGAPNSTGGQYDTNPHANMGGLPDLSAADITPPSSSAMRQLYRRFNTILDTYPPEVQPDLSCDFTQGRISIDDTTLCFDEDASGMMLARITGPDGTIRTMPVTDNREFQDACHTAISVARPDATPLKADSQADEEHLHPGMRRHPLITTRGRVVGPTRIRRPPRSRTMMTFAWNRTGHSPSTTTPTRSPQRTGIGSPGRTSMNPMARPVTTVGRASASKRIRLLRTVASSPSPTAVHGMSAGMIAGSIRIAGSNPMAWRTYSNADGMTRIRSSS